MEHSLLEETIRERFPNTSFCIPFQPPDDYEVEVENQNRPTPSPLENLVVLSPIRVNGVLVRQYKVEPASPEQIEQRTAVQASLIRSQRNHRLAQTDWTQLPDSGADQASWAAYRQALRSLPQQPGFPWEVTWPQAPGSGAPAAAASAPMAELPQAETLGQLWTAPGGEQWIVVQARGANGQFMADDPATESRENLKWEKV